MNEQHIASAGFVGVVVGRLASLTNEQLRELERVASKHPAGSRPSRWHPMRRRAWDRGHEAVLAEAAALGERFFKE